MSPTCYDAPMRLYAAPANDGISIHGSEVACGYATHGCIGVPEAFAKRLSAIAALGDRVIITARQADSASRPTLTRVDGSPGGLVALRALHDRPDSPDRRHGARTASPRTASPSKIPGPG